MRSDTRRGPARQHQRVVRSAVVAIITAMAAVVAACASPPSPSGPVASPPVASSRPGPAGTSTLEPPAGGSPGASPTLVPGDVAGATLEVIEAHRPFFTFRLTPEGQDGDWLLDGDADDGSGPGRLFVAVTETAGEMAANPCADPDFRQSGMCTERDLPDGSCLFLRDLVEANGTRTVLVALVHPDRSGITAEATNFSMAGLSPPILQASRPTPTVTRAAPLYSVTELAELVMAIDEGLEARGD